LFPFRRFPFLFHIFIPFPFFHGKVGKFLLHFHPYPRPCSPWCPLTGPCGSYGQVGPSMGPLPSRTFLIQYWKKPKLFWNPKTALHIWNFISGPLWSSSWCLGSNPRLQTISGSTIINITLLP
jgi:hypothetical protein